MTSSNNPPPALRSRLFRTVFYTAYLLIVVFICLEIILRIYYPFPTRIRGDRFELSTNTTFRIRNHTFPRLDSVIINRRNSIGFRGSEPARDMTGRLSILAVGGSTTACTYLSEGRTWTDLMEQKLSKPFPSVWINNAGIDGHSTYGHYNLLRYYLPSLAFRPKIALFLVGFNDVNRRDLDSNERSYDDYPGSRIRKWALLHLETANLLFDLKNTLFPVSILPPASEDSSGGPPLSHQEMDSAVKSQDCLLTAYRQRLYRLIDICRLSNIRPVFITQPMAVDTSSPPGKWQLLWRELQPYNETTRQVAREKNILCIDLAEKMPRDTAFYYDKLHYTNKGAEKVSEIICQDLSPWLGTNFPELRPKPGPAVNR
ncbi:SGNH/GDSL hydrolase family protein [Puia sp. P3]|uniref:SGNH/GDSL hydrolase family protein n=1 Tax=Puia sp. P3 TaxID=3423952 RepID=UPI003D67F436